MNKLICLLICLMMASCATVTIDGDKITVKKPVGSSINVAVTDATGKVTTISAGSSIPIDQIAAMGLSGYSKYMSGGLISTPVATPQAVLVPKAAQATPPPAEIPLVR